MKRTLMRTLSALSAVILYCVFLPTVPLSAETTTNQPADTEETKELFLGDFNGDDQLTVMDAVLLSRFIAEDTTLNAVVYPEAGDMDENDIFNMADLSLMLSQLLGIYDTPGELPDKMGCIYQIREEIPVSDEASAREAIVQTAEQLGITVSETAEEFVLSDVSSNTNHTFYTMQQQYQGVDVYGGSLRLAVNEDGFCDTVINGFAELPEEINIAPEQTSEQVQETLEQNTEDITVLYCEYQHTWLEAESGKLMYEFYVTAESEEQFGHYSVFADADSAEILAWYCNDSGASTKRTYSDDDVTVDLNLESVDGGGYCLEDTKRNIYVFDANHRAFGRENTRFCSNPQDSIDSVRSDGLSFSDSDTQRDALKMMAYIANAQDYYTEILGCDNNFFTVAAINDRNAYDLYARSNYEVYSYPFHYAEIGSEASAYIRPDIIAHEYTHNLLKSKYKVPYGRSDEAAAVHEAYADVMAMCITRDRDWTILENTLSATNRNIASHSLAIALGNAKYAGSLDYSNAAYRMYDYYINHMRMPSDEAFDRVARIWYNSIRYLPNVSLAVKDSDKFPDDVMNAVLDSAKNLESITYVDSDGRKHGYKGVSGTELIMIRDAFTINLKNKLKNDIPVIDLKIKPRRIKYKVSDVLIIGNPETTTDAITFDDGKLYFYPNESINRAEVELSIEKYNGDNKLKVHALRDDPEADFDVVEIGMNLPDAVGLENVSKISHIQIEFTCVAQEPWVKDDGSSELVVGLMMGALGGQLADEKRYDDDRHIIQNTWTQSNFLFEDWQSPEHSWVFESDGPFNTLPGNKFAENYEGAALIVMRWSQRNAVDFYIDNIAFYDAEGNIIPIIST